MSDYITENEAKAAVDENKTGNISKQKREDLLKKIEEIRKYISNAPQDENTGNLLSYLSEIEKDVNGKKYGLVFEEHREDIDEVLDTHTPVLTEDKDLFIDNGGQMNYLIEGDNLASLQLLEKTHKGKVDLIYIDPPYNTCNKDFVYDDKYIGSDDLFKHSKWLSFMEKRLKISKKLLSQRGIIVISINDIENATIKLLCDEVFGNENFVANLVWKSRQNKDNRNISGVSNDHEYLICYSSQPNTRVFRGEDRKTEQYSNPDNDPRGPWVSANMAGILDATQRPNCHYDLIHPVTKVNYGRPKMGWRYDINTMNKLISEDRILFPKNPKGRPRRKVFLYELSDKKTGYSSIVGKEIFTRDGTSDIDKLFEKRVFQYPKPVDLLFEIFYQTLPENGIVLDFFAGSGSSGHATLKLNSDKGGNRIFILCTNNENNICRDVTYERIKRVIDKENYSASLKYYKVDYLPISERMYYEYANELLKHIRELVELENGINFIGNAEIAIVLTDEELNEFTSNIEQYSSCKKLYMGHDLLPDEEHERIISENNIEISIIPDYYYKDLQEK